MPVGTQGKNGSAILVKIPDRKCNKELKVLGTQKMLCATLGAKDGSEQAMVATVLYQGEGKQGLESFHDDSLGQATQHKCWSKVRKNHSS